jgi:hypothetical protein
MFGLSLRCAALLLGVGLFAFSSVEAGNATTISLGSGTYDNTTSPASLNYGVAGRLDLTLTLNGAYDSNDPTAGVYGSITMTLGTQSNPAMSVVELDPFPSTPGSTNYGDQSNAAFVSDSVTDISTWHAFLSASDYPASLTINSNLFGFPTDASPSLEYVFSPSTVAAVPLGPMPLWLQGLICLLAWFGWMRTKHRLLGTL